MCYESNAFASHKNDTFSKCSYSISVSVLFSQNMRKLDCCKCIRHPTEVLAQTKKKLYLLKKRQTQQYSGGLQEYAMFEWVCMSGTNSLWSTECVDTESTLKNSIH